MRQLYTYALPPGARVGHAAAVPLGPREITAYVVELLPAPDCDPAKVRPIRRLLDPEPAFDAQQLTFFRWIANYYLHPLGEVIASALPSGLRGSGRTVLRGTEAGVDALAGRAILDAEEAEVLREVVAHPGLTRRGLLNRLRDLLEGESAEKALDRVIRRGLVARENEEVEGPGQQVRVIRLAREPHEKLGSRQFAVVADLRSGPQDLPVLLARHGQAARDSINKLLEAGILVEESRERRDAVTLGELPARREPPPLTPAQAAAVESILGPPRPWLLHGVTGAGKTEVYLGAAAAVLQRGLQVLVLVPEIGLTPLLTGRFRARFGDAVAVLHSGLTGAERLREWRRIRAGAARVAVGARSALFAPFHDLGLIVVDEEHDDSYKQDDGVRYNARDLAVVRGVQAKCPVVLGSATPSLETWKNARDERYGLIRLTERPTPRPVPVLEVVDQNQQPRVNGQLPLLSPPLQDALERCFAAGNKAILLYNRRGYATFVQCEGCGAGYECPSCGISLVLHKGLRQLRCHYCDFSETLAPECVVCGGHLEELGTGTERVEEVVGGIFSEIPIGRMDADTTAARGSHHRILEDFRLGRTRLLLGTQIVAKGHDFPDVEVAAVISADHSLRMPDFRAAERTYSLLVQLAGRAGRGEMAGRVIVQTHHPEHFVFQHLDDFDRFAKAELRHRELLRHPPVVRLAMIRFEGADREAVRAAAQALHDRLVDQQPGVTLNRPTFAALPRLVGRWRMQLLLRSMDAGSLHRLLQRVEPTAPRGVRVSLDLDPRHLG